MGYLQIFTAWLEKTTGIPAELYGRLITSLTGIMVLWLLRWLVLKMVWRRTDDSRTRYQWRKFPSYVVFTEPQINYSEGWFGQRRIFCGL